MNRGREVDHVDTRGGKGLAKVGNAVKGGNVLESAGSLASCRRLISLSSGVRPRPGRAGNYRRSAETQRFCALQ